MRPAQERERDEEGEVGVGVGTEGERLTDTFVICQETPARANTGHRDEVVMSVRTLVRQARYDCGHLAASHWVRVDEDPCDLNATAKFESFELLACVRKGHVGRSANKARWEPGGQAPRDTLIRDEILATPVGGTGGSFSLEQRSVHVIWCGWWNKGRRLVCNACADALCLESQ